jgi:hypothetical protein
MASLIRLGSIEYVDLARDMPEADGLVHGGGENEEVLGPGDVQEIAGVPRVRHKGPVHEDVTLDVSANNIMRYMYVM